MTPLFSNPAPLSALGSVLTAFCLSVVVNLLLTSHRLRHLATDQPNARSLHQHPTPRLGGLGILAGTLTAQAIGPHWPTAWQLAVGLLAGISLADDFRPLAPLLRLAVHGACAGLAAQPLLADGSGWVIAAAVLTTVRAVNLNNYMD